MVKELIKLRRKTLRLVGLKTPLGKIKIVKLAVLKKPETVLLCPHCDQRPVYDGKYTCEYCGTEYGDWRELKRVVRGTEEVIVQEKLPKSDVAQLYIMNEDMFSEYCDATKTDYGVIPLDELTALNLKKLLVASQKLGKVIILRFNDVYEERICVLTTSLSGRIILKELVPINLLKEVETMKIDMVDVSDDEIKEAEIFTKMLPKAKEETLEAKDYRTIGLKRKKTKKEEIEIVFEDESE